MKFDFDFNNGQEIIAIDGDGVLFDYNQGVANMFYQLTKLKAPEINSKAYNSFNQFNFDNDSFPKFKDLIYPLFDKYKYWGKLPIYDNVKQSLDIIVNKGYKLVCLTSMPPKYQSLRFDNAKKFDLPIHQVVAVDRRAAKKLGINNPKLEFIESVKPFAFIDDLIKNFIDMNHINDTKLVWLDNQNCHTDNPNLAFDKLYHEKFTSLLDFANSLPNISIKNKSNFKHKP